MAIKDYNTDPDLNTTISGINIAEGCPPSGINNAIRQLMADVKKEKEAKDAEQAAKDAEQAAKDAKQDAAIEEALNRMSMPLGMVFPFTGKDVPAGTLRADGATYTNMQASFPDFYEWVVNSGLSVPLADYALVEGSCGCYGLDTSTGTVRMPTLAAGVFGTDVASRYGLAVQAGLPDFYGQVDRVLSSSGAANNEFGAMVFISDGSYAGEYATPGAYASGTIAVQPSKSKAIYGKSDTVTPSHVKYTWVIVVYNAAVAPSVAQAGEFVELLDGKADKEQLNYVVPAGTVIAFAANKAPDGFLLCNGAAVSRTTYATLFSAIGTTYGEGDGSSTFNLPNLTDRFIQGSGTAGTVKEAGLPEISGNVAFRDMLLADGCFAAVAINDQNSAWTGYLQQHAANFYASRSSSVYGGSTTVQPPAVTMRYYIKY